MMTRIFEHAHPPHLRWLVVVAVAALCTLGVAAAAFMPIAENPVSSPDFAALEDIDVRKQTFFNFLAPLVAERNRQLTRERAQLLLIYRHASDDLSVDLASRRKIRRWAERYQLAYNPEQPLDTVRELLSRLDLLPESMVLAQAALESGWGTSRFAEDANNYFGQWCFSAGCGLVPERRGAGKDHEVAVFDSPEEAVKAYFVNINRHEAYANVRRLRAHSRCQQRPLLGVEIVNGLQHYSGIGPAYVDNLKSLIAANNLDGRYHTRHSSALSICI